MVLALRYIRRCDDDRFRVPLHVVVVVGFVEGHVVGIIKMVIVKSVWSMRVSRW